MMTLVCSIFVSKTDLRILIKKKSQIKINMEEKDFWRSQKRNK